MSSKEKQYDASLQALIATHGWMHVPETIVTREGYRINTSSDLWEMYIPEGKKKLYLHRASNNSLSWAVKRYLVHRIQSTSSIEGYNTYNIIGCEILVRQDQFGITPDIAPEDLRDRLVDLMQAAIAEARAKRRLWALYRVARWYIWCADNFPEVGFCTQYANELDGIRFSGNPKGEAVRASDPEAGPLDRVYELPILRQALEDDDSEEWAHLQEKAALALCLAFGRNAANLSWLNESDFGTELRNIDGLEPFHTLHIPRIKKRQRHPRQDFRVEPLDRPLAKHVQKLIEANQQVDAVVLTDSGPVKVDRPLLMMRRRSSGEVVPAAHVNAALRINASAISGLLQRFVQRHQLISPLTNERLFLTTRRLRYTVATALVEEGISRRELAEFLDHSDTQHVEVYFELKGQIVRHLDAAAAPKLAKYFRFFKGNIISDDSEAINGQRDDKHLSFVNEAEPQDQVAIGVCGESAICNLDPPYSCYLCPKFQPYQSADHEHVMKCLLTSREARLQQYETARLGVQLDDVIIAVSNVIGACKQEQQEEEGELVGG